MTISKDLLLAILSLDSYNRGYHAGISDDGPDDKDGLGVANAKIGTATVFSDNGLEDAKAAGFYAISYKIDDGSKIDGLNTNVERGDTITAYRGTNDKPEFATLI